jgi:hypothetical protein
MFEPCMAYILGIHLATFQVWTIWFIMDSSSYISSSRQFGTLWIHLATFQVLDNLVDHSCMDS